MTLGVGNASWPSNICDRGELNWNLNEQNITLKFFFNFNFYFFIYIFFLLHSVVTQLHIHVYILFSHITWSIIID